MTERGVLVSINSDSGEEMRHLNQEAAKAIKWGGMSEIEALKLVTLNPAKQLLIDDRVGSIEVGKDADLVIYDGNPLEIRVGPAEDVRRWRPVLRSRRRSGATGEDRRDQEETGDPSGQEGRGRGSDEEARLGLRAVARGRLAGRALQLP